MLKHSFVIGFIQSIIEAIVCVNIQGDKIKMPKLAYWQTAKSS